MLIFVIAVVVIFVVVVAAIFLANGTARFDEAVQKNQKVMDNVDSKYNMALTQGNKIAVGADVETQLREARILAAKQAAAMPRGANMRIGRLGQADELQTAWKGVENDPITAVKIAAHHGWDGLKTGAVAVAPAVAAPAPAAGGKIELVAGKDYPVIEITDDMSPADKRKARIANSKAKSAALRAAKAGAASASAPAAAPASGQAAAPVATAVAIPEPERIEITEDMPPDEKRKARIADSKAKSAYKKALKAAGIDPKAAVSPAPAAAPAAAPEAVADMPPPPELIELTDDMPPEEKRAARIANSKAKSAYKKALKAAGIDPKSVKV